MTSVSILTLKVGLVATVTGASIATPILLNRGSGVSSVTSQNSVTEGVGEQGDIAARGTSDQLVQRGEDSAVDSGRSVGVVSSGSDDMTSAEEVSDQANRTETVSGPALSHIESSVDVSHADSERESDGQGVRAENNVQRTGASDDSLNQVASSLASEVPSAKKVAGFDKKCFVIPAKSTGSDSVELLTCYEDQKINAKVVEEREEYDSLFHIYDKSRLGNPIEIDKDLMWSPTNKQLTATLTEKSDYETEYIFTVTGGEWDGISSDSRNLLTPKECAIYKVDSEVANSQYILTCGDDSSSYDPKGITLTIWSKN